MSLILDKIGIGDMMSKIVAIIQARMGSTRLQGKVMKDLCGKPVLSHDIERIKQANTIDEIVIATTLSEIDDIIVRQSIKDGVKVYRGSEDNVLSRYYEASIEYKADVIVRITSDCPLIDPHIIDEVINFYLQNEYDLVTNAGIFSENRTYPRGLDVEVFSFKMLKEAFNKANREYHLEHVTPYIYENSNNIYYYKNNEDKSNHRWTLDTDEDFELIQAIFHDLYEGTHNFYFNEILDLFDRKPKLFNINNHVEQKKI